MKRKRVREAGATYAVGLTGSSPTIAAFRNRHGESVEAASVTATDAKNEFGSVLETVMRGGVVVITKHDAPKAVLISVDEFNALSHATEARLQAPKARARMKAAVEASPKQLGKAAEAVARMWDDASAGARAGLLARLRAQPVVDVGRWTRDELYEDGR